MQHWARRNDGDAQLRTVRRSSAIQEGRCACQVCVCVCACVRVLMLRVAQVSLGLSTGSKQKQGTKRWLAARSAALEGPKTGGD